MTNHDCVTNDKNITCHRGTSETVTNDISVTCQNVASDIAIYDRGIALYHNNVTNASDLSYNNQSQINDS